MEKFTKGGMIYCVKAEDKLCKTSTGVLPLFMGSNKSLTTLRGYVSVLCCGQYAA